MTNGCIQCVHFVTEFFIGIDYSDFLGIELDGSFN